MARFCTTCGAELKPDAAFCTNCGASGSAPAAPEPQPTVWTQPIQTAPPAPSPPAAPVVPTEEPVGTGTFFGLMLLFALPVIIMCFVPKRKSLRSFARATLIWFVIALILSLLLGFAAKALLNAAAPYFEQFTAEMGGLGELGELFEQLGELEGLRGSLPVE